MACIDPPKLTPGSALHNAPISDVSPLCFGDVHRALVPILAESSRLTFFHRSFSWATASGQFLRPAASRLLLSGFLPNSVGPSIKQPFALGAAASRFWVPQENGARKRRKIHVLPQLSDEHRLRRRRPGAASSAEQRFKIHRSFRRHATLLEKRRRRMGLESRVAPHLHFSVRGSPNTLRQRSRRELTSSSKANSRAQPTSARTARARSPRRSKSRPGRFALTLCTSSIAAPMLRAKRLNHRMRLPSSGATNRAPALPPRPFLFFAFKLQSNCIFFLRPAPLASATIVPSNNRPRPRPANSFRLLSPT
jgi:hypothetical protein